MVSKVQATDPTSINHPLRNAENCRATTAHTANAAPTTASITRLPSSLPGFAAPVATCAKTFNTTEAMHSVMNGADILAPARLRPISIMMPAVRGRWHRENPDATAPEKPDPPGRPPAYSVRMATQPNRLLVITFLGAVLVPSMAGCVAESSDPVTLTIATDDAATAPAGVQITHLVEEVQRRSSGSLLIEPMCHAAGRLDRDWDQANAQLVIDGKADLGLIPTRAWDMLGVTTLTPLTAPFRITNDDLLDEVVSGDLRGDLLSGLDQAGVTGLDLFPEGLRHPFGYKEPVLGVKDYQGAVIRTPTSKTAFALFQAFGATPVGDQADSLVQKATDSSFALTPAAIATGNVTLFPKVNALVAGPSYNKLTAKQQRILADAAEATREWTIKNSLTDADAAVLFCSQGGRIVAASDAQSTELQDAALPVMDALLTNTAVANMMTEIAKLKETHPDPAPVKACAAPTPGVGSTAIDGTYRLKVTRQDFDERGVTKEADIGQNLGEFTWTFTAGNWRYKQLLPDGRTLEGAGAYTLDGDDFTFYWSHEAGDFSAAKVNKQADGSLRFTDVTDGMGDELQPVSEALFGAHLFKAQN